MINNIVGSGSVVVSGGGGPLPYVNANPNNPLQGMMRVNGSNIEVYDGHGWVVVSVSYPSVSLTGEVESVLNWAREQRTKQLQREIKAASNPALKKAYEAISRAEENFDLLEAIASDYQFLISVFLN